MERLSYKTFIGTGLALGLGLAACGQEVSSVSNRVVAEASVDNTKHFATDGVFTHEGNIKNITAHVEVECNERGAQAPSLRVKARTLGGQQIRTATIKNFTALSEQPCTIYLSTFGPDQAVDYVNKSLDDVARAVAGDGNYVEDSQELRNKLIDEVKNLGN